MPLFRKKHEIVDAIQLSWDNWGEICRRGGIGLLKDGKAEGNLEGTSISMKIRGTEGDLDYTEGDWIFMHEGKVCGMRKAQFKMRYEPYEEAEA